MGISGRRAIVWTEMQLSDFITPTTPAGAALLLKWNEYHVFSIPKRELVRSSRYVRFFGVGGKRADSRESFVHCALRESAEEIGDVISELQSADCTYWMEADGKLQPVDFVCDSLVCDTQPRLIMEKRNHTGQGSMTNPNQSYYLVAFDASLAARPQPSSEIAAILYLTDRHLTFVGAHRSTTLSDLMQQGAQLECQTDSCIDQSRIAIPHGTALFLIKQQLFRQQF